MNLGNVTLLVGALAALASVLTGSYFVWRKLRPEITSIHIKSANSLVTLSTEAASLIAGERDKLRLRLDALEQKLEGFEEKVEEAEHRAATANNLVAELTRENTRLRNRVQTLEKEVKNLRSQEAGRTKREGGE